MPKPPREDITGLLLAWGGGDRAALDRLMPLVYQLYLKGRYHLNRLTDEGFLKGRGYFQQAIDLDPNYAPAHAGLADAYQMLGGYNALAPKEVIPQGEGGGTEGAGA